MEPESALVWTDGTVVLNSETPIDLNLTAPVLPWYAELYNTLWVNYPLKDRMIFKFLIHLDNNLNSFQNAPQPFL